MPFRFLSSMAPPKDDPGNLNVSHPTFKPNPLPQIPALPPPAQGWPNFTSAVLKLITAEDSDLNTYTSDDNNYG